MLFFIICVLLFVIIVAYLIWELKNEQEMTLFYKQLSLDMRDMWRCSEKKYQQLLGKKREVENDIHR